MRVAEEALVWSGSSKVDRYIFAIWETRTRGFRVEANGPQGDIRKSGFLTLEDAKDYAWRIAMHMRTFEIGLRTDNITVVK